MPQQITTKPTQQHPKPTHNTSSHSKISITFPSQLNHFEEDDSDTPVLVYLYAHGCKSIKISLSPSISVQDIKSAIEESIGIRRDMQCLYLNGKEITNYGNIRLQNNNIIHVSSRDQVCHADQKIKFKLTVINFIDQKQQKIYKDYTVSANQWISDFLTRLQKDLDWVFGSQNQHFQLLQSGRLLQRQKTFIQQNVPSSTAITCILTKNEIKTRFINDTKEEIFNDISELLGFGEQVQKKTDNKQQQLSRPHNVDSSEEKTNRSFIKQEKPAYQQEISQNIHQQMQPNFKKKKNNFLTLEGLECQSKVFLKKLKSSKTKKQLDQLLTFQGHQNFMFEQSKIIKKQMKIQECPNNVQPQLDTHKAALIIPKGMPVQQRKQIRMQMQKLLNTTEQAKPEPVAAKNDSKVQESKEQKKPFSPATQTPKPKEKMRLSMGSRPAFLDQLKF